MRIFGPRATIDPGKGKEETHPQSGLTASEALEEGKSHVWESDDWSSSQWPDDCWTPAAGLRSTKAHTVWMAVPSLNLAYHPTHVVLDLGCTRSIGSRSATERFQKHSWYYGEATECCCCKKSFVSANPETETCLGSCIIHFLTTPPCSTMVDVLETGNVPILFSLPKLRNFWVRLLNWILNESRLHVHLGLFSLFS